MSDTERPKLVAETDALGKVRHVWISMPGWKCARPVDRARLQAGVIASSEVHGASRSDIASWLKQNGYSA
jgi:hypothetical protein